jgi:hypothetical protein
MITSPLRDRAQCRVEIEKCLGKTAVTYADNKVRGGSNGKKGTRYEDFFTAFKVAQEAVQHLEEPTEWPIIEDQAYAFVDDLVVTYSSTQTHYHQLKNTQALSWTGGAHSLKGDFESQAVLCNSCAETAFLTTLVVSDEKVFAAMKQLPESIEGHSKVELFPYAGGNANRLSLEHLPLRTLLCQLTRIEDPMDDDLGYVFGMLMLGLQQAGSATTMETVIETAQKASPSLIRLLPYQFKDTKLKPEFVKILGEIEDLEYVTKRGFFSWKAFGMSGVLQFNCLSPEFLRFQERVVEMAPATFDAFEKLLP